MARAVEAGTDFSPMFPVRGWNKRWVLAPGVDADTSRPLAQRILAARGYADADAAQAFLDPKLTHLHDPSLIPDLDRAASRILDAIKSRQPIVIYGDYDVDGITATTILFHTIRAIDPGALVTTYVPHRLDEGYGLNVEAIKSLAAGGAKVIISVDCGVTAVNPAAAAASAGVDLIITDHHNSPSRIEDLPRAYAVVHPRRPDSPYPFDHLSGAGVAYKLAWRLGTLDFGGGKASPAMRSLLVDLLAFAALGSIADVVPLIGENRVIAKFGLTRIQSSPIRGLRALVDASGLGGEKVSAWDVGFRLGPRLNASGRMAHACEAVELFTTADDDRAKQIASDLEARNQQRRTVEAQILEHAARLVEERGMHRDDKRAIVLSDPAWHKGVVGIVCSRLVEKFCRPAILMQTEHGHCHGSGRSIDGYNLHGGLASCAHLLTKFGGHDMAAGLALDESKLPDFVEAFTAHANAHITPEQLIHDLRIDALSTLAELSPASVQALESLAPFGRSNPGVHVHLADLAIHSATPMGKGGDHLAILARQGQHVTRFIAWRWGEHRPRLLPGVRFDAVVRPQINTFSGRATVEPELLDLRTH